MTSHQTKANQGCQEGQSWAQREVNFSQARKEGRSRHPGNPVACLGLPVRRSGPFLMWCMTKQSKPDTVEDKKCLQAHCDASKAEWISSLTAYTYELAQLEHEINHSQRTSTTQHSYTGTSTVHMYTPKPTFLWWATTNARKASRCHNCTALLMSFIEPCCMSFIELFCM
jgi:hypothetical protein